MGLELKKDSKWWYGRWMRDGKRHFSRLRVEAVGQPGDEKFEESKKAALVELDKKIAECNLQKRPEDLVQDIHRVKFGHRIGSIPLTGLFTAWKNIPRKRQPKERYVDWAERTIIRLLDFIIKEFPKVKEMAGVDRKIAEAFMRDEEGRHISPKTFNAELILLRGAFEHLREDAGMLTNPFNKMVTKDQDTFHRKPFTAEELRAIVDVVKDDNLMRPLIITGVCTAMRRGDACLLKWDAIDFEHGFVTVKTSKTGETVEIPLLSMLREELEHRPKSKSKYVFPTLASMYQKNPDGINWRLGKIFEKAGFINEQEIKDRNKGRKRAGLPPLTIARRGDSHAGRKEGIYKSNVRGFHSFRVTWITIALAAGVPMELVRRVTGHKAADVVLKNYFKPGRNEFKRLIEGAMPALMMLGTGEEKPEDKKTPGELLEDAIKGLEGLPVPSKKAGAAWVKERDRIAALIRKVKGLVEPKAIEVASA